MSKVSHKSDHEDDMEVAAQNQRNMFLANFPANKYPDNAFRPECPDVALAIIDLIKKEGMTYVDAYASLQLAYDQLQYESNFVQTQ